MVRVVTEIMPTEVFLVVSHIVLRTNIFRPNVDAAPLADKNVALVDKIIIRQRKMGDCVKQIAGSEREDINLRLLRQNVFD